MLESLKAYRQWCVWKLEHRPGEAKAAKIPYNAMTGQRASSTNPADWCSYDEACAVVATGQYSGIGFVFTENDKYTFIDLDSCRNPETGAWLQEAHEIFQRFAGAAMEVSQSGTGAHIIGSTFNKSLFANHRNKFHGWIEVYRSGRFIAMSGNTWQGDPDVDITGALLEWLPVRPAGANAESDNVASVGRDPRWIGPEDDDELIKRMMVHKEPDAKLLANLADQIQKAPDDALLRWQYEKESKEKIPFEWYWKADMRLGEHHHDNAGSQGRSFDWSAADQALMNKLAFWTGKDWPRMQRIFSRSALAQREKWQTRAWYRNATTAEGIRWSRNVYGGNNDDKRDEWRRKQQQRENEKIGDAFSYEDHVAPILKLEEIHERFIYVHTINWFVDIKTFTPYKVDNSEITFASCVTAIPTGQRDKDTGQEIVKHVNSVTLWRKEYLKQKYYADVISWKPNGNPICEVPESFSRGVNMWRGLVRPRWADYYRDNEALRVDAITAWRAHLEYLIPYEVERVRFEKWLAHMLQRPEVLPHTAYLMYTPEVGTGRNWLSSVLVRVLRGYVAAGVDIQEVLDGSFNGRLSQKLLAIVDEAKAGMQDAKRYARSERLKTLVNQSSREINVKHGLQTVEHNCMRWLFFSNHADALPFDNNDRRIVVIANPTTRHPNGATYYAGLYGLLDNDAFISAVWAHLMYGVDVSDFNPGEHAPMNAAKRAALIEMQSEGEKAVKEFAARSPGDFATNRQLRNWIDRYCGDQSGTKAHAKLLNIWMEKAGMVSTGEQIRINGQNERIMIVRNYDRENFANLEREFIAKIIGQNDVWLKLE